MIETIFYFMTCAFRTDITAQETKVSELEQVVELVCSLQGNPLLVSSPVTS